MKKLLLLVILAFVAFLSNCAHTEVDRVDRHTLKVTTCDSLGSVLRAVKHAKVKASYLNCDRLFWLSIDNEKGCVTAYCVNNP